MTSPRIYRHDQPFAMRRGGVLPSIELAYETWGTLSASKDNAVLILTGLSPSAHAASHHDDPSEGWWEALLGAGKAIDTEQWYVVCVNSLGSCWGSTGPASIDPKTGERYGPTFPELCLEDVAAAAGLVLDHLGVEQLNTLIGPSMGGMSALAYLIQRPGTVKRLLSISSALYSEPFATAIRALQREAVWSDPEYADGWYPPDQPPARGMRLARKVGMISYRSAEEWRGRFKRDRIDGEKAHPFAPEFQVESYLELHAQRFVGSFDPNCYLWLSRAMDWFDPTAGQSPTHMMAGLGLNDATVIGVESDMLFPMHQQKAIAAALQGAGVPTQFDGLASIQGHDSFLVDIERFDPAIRRAMSTKN